MSYANLLALRRIPASELVDSQEHYTAEFFGIAARMDTPDVVVIPACNEQEDLPAALVSLARSARPVVPVVVENGSRRRDRTTEYAERMGAIVLSCESAKMRATQIGLQFARSRFPEQPVVHFGDADNIYPRALVPAMARAAVRANLCNERNGALVFGMGAYEHGPSTIVDLMRSGRILRKAVLNKAKDKSPMPYGANYALHVADDSEELLEGIYALNPLLFVREESEICAAALTAGASVSQLVRPSAYVFTRGDLIRTRDEWRRFKGAPMDVKTEYYKRNYPDVDFLPNPEGRNRSL
jgi:hypothetical protein